MPIDQEKAKLAVMKTPFYHKTKPACITSHRDDDEMLLTEKMAWEIQSRGVTPSAIAKHLDMNRNEVARVLKDGISFSRVRYLERIARALGVRIVLVECDGGPEKA